MRTRERTAGAGRTRVRRVPAPSPGPAVHRVSHGRTFGCPSSRLSAGRRRQPATIPTFVGPSVGEAGGGAGDCRLTLRPRGHHRRGHGRLRRLGGGVRFTDVEEKASVKAGRVAKRAFELGLLIETSGPESEVVKLLPALTITPDELDEGMKTLARAVRETA